MTTKTSANENPSRRNFIKNGLALSVGATVSGINHKAIVEQMEIEVSNGNSQKLKALFDLKYPIFQAAPGGEELCIAVTNAGAMGAIQLSWSSPEESFDMVKRIKAATKGSFYANYILHFEPKSLDNALEAGVPVVEFSFGIPNKTVVSKIRSAKAKFGIQVGSMDGAKAALDMGVDFLICQGIEAGGHVQAGSTLTNALQEVLKVAKTTPVLASGGIATGFDIRKVINTGAAGAVLGTRFLATKESEYHNDYKNALVQAKENSTVFTNCFNKDWDALHRVLKNKTYERWQAAGCPTHGSKPGESDIVATGPDDFKIERYMTTPPLKYFKGSITDLAMYAGQGVHKVNNIPAVHELIQQLWREYEGKE